jgi:hypothetical protein
MTTPWSLRWDFFPRRQFAGCRDRMCMSLTCWLDGNGDRPLCSGQSYERRLARSFFLYNERSNHLCRTRRSIRYSQHYSRGHPVQVRVPRSAIVMDRHEPYRQSGHRLVEKQHSSTITLRKVLYRDPELLYKQYSHSNRLFASSTWPASSVHFSHPQTNFQAFSNISRLFSTPTSFSSPPR